MRKETVSKLIKSTALFVGCLSITAIAVPAQAATVTFDWTLAGPVTSLGGFGTPGSGAGTFTVTTGANADIIAAMTGEIDGNAVTLLPQGTDGSDNLLFPIGTSFTGGMSVVDLDTSGIAVSTTLGDYHIFGAGSPFSIGTVSGNDIDEVGPGGFGVGTLAVSAVPEPSTWAMMILGFAGIGAMTYHRRKSTMFAAA
jgi:PEP-CTERM motif